MANTKIQSEQIEDDIALGGNPTTTTQSAGNNTTRVATTAFVTTAVANLVDSAPSALDTLNELAAAMGDDASFSTTITNSIATKLPLAGGTMTGDIAHASDFTIDAGGDITLDADGADIILKDGGTSFAELDKDNNNFRIKNPIADGDIKIQGVDGSSTITALDFDMSNAGAATFNSFIYLDYIRGKNDNNTGINVAGSDVLELQTGGGARLVVNSSGNVGIGVAAANIAKPLHISSSDNQPLRVESEDAYAGIEIKDSGSATLPPLISALSNDFIFYGGHASSRPEMARLTTGGNGSLQVNGVLSFEPGGPVSIDASNGRPNLARNADGELRIAAGKDSNGFITFHVTPSGSTNVMERFKMADNVTFTGRAGTSPIFSMVNSDNEDTSTGRETSLRFSGFRSGGESVDSAQISGSHYGSSDDDRGQLIFYTNNGSGLTEKARIIDDGGITFNGDTASANALDDYEEGTHATAFTASTSGSISVSPNTMAYTKVGRLVTCTGYFAVSSVSSPVGLLFISLPFTAASGYQFSTSASVSFNTLASGQVYEAWPIVVNGTDKLRVYIGTGTGVSASFAQLLQQASDVRVTVSYMTA